MTTPTLTITDRTPALAELDPDAIYADEMLTEAGDNLLRETARGERTATVKSGRRSSWTAPQSHTARAWTVNGSVD